MDHSITAPIDGLRRDHARMRSVLTLIAHQLDKLETTGTGDYVLLANALYYMRKFPSQVHHPKEDAIFDHLMARDPTYAKEVQRIREQHMEIYEMEEWLVEMALHEPKPHTTDLRKLIDFGRHYLQLQREHCRAEETMLFPRAGEALTKHDWAQVSHVVKDVEDPLFGKHRQERFQSLYDYIMRESDGA